VSGAVAWLAGRYFDPAAHENAVIEFLNGEEVRRWVEATLGL
jgi:hypothetical protein